MAKEEDKREAAVLSREGADQSGLERRIDVQALLQGLSEVRLIHQGAEYRLRVTRQGKLILTK